MLLTGMFCLAGAIGLMAYLLLARVAPAGGTPAIVTPGRATEDRTSSALAPLYARLGRLAGKLTPKGYERRLQHRLDLAGNPRGWHAQRVLALKALGLLLGLALGSLAGAHHGGLAVALAGVLGVAGFFFPDAVVRNLGERRHNRIVIGLPDATDMMTVCVEAGLGFDAALGRVARTLSGPVAEEFARVLQEMQFGLSRAEALRAMSARTDVVELRTFATALVQSSELGISVGDVLREQAREMRVKRRQRAEERAQKLPVKMLMPLIVCLLPSLFVVVLGPALLNVVHAFSGGGYLG